jgi:hypothetical protein
VNPYFRYSLYHPIVCRMRLILQTILSTTTDQS